MPKSIFDLVTADQITAYWDVTKQNMAPVLGEELFPADKKLGLDLKWLHGAKGLPVVLKPSAYDAVSLKRDRIGFKQTIAEMPFFKESMYIDEELRQQLNMVLETGNAAYIDSIMNKIFDDDTQLLIGARAQRERMRMSLLTTGTISIAANGQNYDYDYGVANEQKVTSDWSDPDADIIGDIRQWQQDASERTGVTPTRFILNSKTSAYFLKNKDLKNAIWGNNAAAPILEPEVKTYLNRALGVTYVTYDNQFIDETGAQKKYIPDDVVTFIPAGKLGKSWFGTTPEESDLMSGSAANVSITDTGVAVTTVKKTDPVNVDTKVSMIFLPSFEQIEQIVIADVSGN